MSQREGVLVLVVKGGLRLGFDGPKSRLANLITLGLLQDHLTQRYLLAAEYRRADENLRQGRVKWQLC